MSLDIYPRSGSLSGDGLNITHNVHPQIAMSGCDPWEFEGRSISETIPEISAAVAFLHDPGNEAELRKLDPSNGWGSLDGSRSFMRDLLRIASEHPDCVWGVSR